ncbi:hypothetical protein EFQ99_19070 [Rhizobium vallis]|uniref:Uncharacterized protein n=2 Tax=Rhizobium vallis TaxID=634290 RepID=A0A3S0T4E5_9HYPH|nr:hypothetical protein EFQ99_19070 [Rhizobium vallis]
MDAYPAERYGLFKGEVTNVGADTRRIAHGSNGFTPRLKLTAIPRSPAGDIKLAAGMTSTVDVITGERRLVSYFFEPLTKALQDSLRER